MKPVRNPFIFLWLLLAVLFSCKKESFTNSPSVLLQASTDSLHFDTVFTSTGSITQKITLANPNNKGIRIASVRLAGGNSSPFRLNVDGIPGPQVTNVEVAGNDSIYVFVTVTINPTAANLAFLVQDSIEVTYNGNRKWIQLDAFGQNAHFFRNRTVKGTETWVNDRPYVILDRLTVDTNALLTISKGCRIYVHADAPFIINGSLKVNGEKWDSTRVVFTGDRLDLPYRDYPAGYPGLIFTDVSQGNVLNYAVIRNAYQGIVATDPAAGTKLTLNETIIDNAYDAGLLGINTSITARNLLISNCGKSMILVKGGDYDFKHTTVAAVSNSFIVHREPALLLTNFLNSVTNPLNASFTNCIFWGEGNGLVEDEVVVIRQGTGAHNVSFNQVLWRVQQNPQFSTITGAINQPPVFDSINTAERFYSFRPGTGSPAINKGVNTSVSLDLDGAPRPVGLPDLGAYEKQ